MTDASTLKFDLIMTKVNVRVIKIRDWSKCSFVFEPLAPSIYRCIHAKGGMHKAFLKFKEEFPDEEIIYNKPYRKPSYGPNGGRSRKNLNPRERSFTIKFHDAANEAFFLLKYASCIE